MVAEWISDNHVISRDTNIKIQWIVEDQPVAMSNRGDYDKSFTIPFLARFDKVFALGFSIQARQKQQ